MYCQILRKASLCCLFLFGISAAMSFAQAPGGPSSDQQGVEAKNSESLMYEIWAPGKSSPSYLFGVAQHISPDSKFPDYAISERIKNVEVVALEFMPDERLTEDFLRASKLRDKKKLKDFYSREEYDQLSAFFIEELSITLEAFVDMQPGFLAMLIKRNSREKEASVHRIIEQYALVHRKPLVGLEEIKHSAIQHLLLDMEDQAALLYEASDRFSSNSESAQEIINAYRESDLSGLSELMIGGDNSFIHEEMKADRNIGLSDRIFSISSDTSCFIAVGAELLLGEEGLIAMLRDMDFEVKPVEPYFQDLPDNWSIVEFEKGGKTMLPEDRFRLSDGIDFGMFVPGIIHADCWAGDVSSEQQSFFGARIDHSGMASANGQDVHLRIIQTMTGKDTRELAGAYRDDDARGIYYHIRFPDGSSGKFLVRFESKSFFVLGVLSAGEDVFLPNANQAFFDSLLLPMGSAEASEPMQIARP
jgi:uncharacterized protein YbaP (TraB family)